MASRNEGGGIRASVVRFLLLMCVFLPSQWASVGGIALDPTLIGRELQKFASDGLGVNDMQADLDNHRFHKEPIKGETKTVEIAIDISNKFKERSDVARQLKAAVEASYAKSTIDSTAQKECCKVDKSTLKYDFRFRSNVDPTNVCLLRSGSASPNPRKLDNDVLKTMKDISNKHPFIKWQYFGSEEGLMTNFPVFGDDEDCAKYDPRYRPFYVETATPEPKDVVLVIDTSSSMTGASMDVAVEAANTVLDTMNPRDRVGVVSFNTVASTPGGVGTRSICYSERLALATPININSLKTYVENLVPTGSTFYSLAFEQAFGLFKGSLVQDSGETRRRVILFLTDGEPMDDESKIFETIRDNNLKCNNSVAILTFGLGKVNQKILQDIADQNGADYSVPQDTSSGDITPGKYTFVEDISTLRSKMATYYNLFASGRQLLHPIVSVPYVDAFGTGLLMSITLPCYNQKKQFIGVAGTDINMEDLLSDITFFNQGQSTYAFMITSSGRTLMHPLLPAPSDAYGDPIFMDIRTLEPEQEFNEVFDSMTMRKTGSKTFVAKRFLARGGREKEGVTVKHVNATYYWTPVQDTDFSVCLVVPVSLENERLDTLEIPNGYKFRYHRIDLDPPKMPCSHFDIYATKDTTVVKFAPGAFLDIYSYLGKDETKANVDLINAYMTDTTGTVNNPGLRPGIRDTVIATWNVEDLWLRKQSELTQYIVWRYIGTSNGIHRVTPGHAYAKGYDPRVRPWYYTALANTGLLALTTPYLDYSGAGVVITVARTLYHGEAVHQHNTNDEVLGVMAADFPLTYFYRLLTKVYPKCKESKIYSCFVMDSAGFLIMHEDFLLSSATKDDLQYVHITEKEKHIAEDLIKKNVLIKKQCRNLEKIQQQSFYEVNLPRGRVDALTSGKRCAKYQLGYISNTNAYLGVAVRETSCAVESCSCFSDNTCHLSPLTCGCPCTSPLEFHYCNSQFPNSSLPICPSPAPQIQSSNDSLPSTSGLQKCFDPHCEEKISQQTCDGVVSCYWCVNNKDDLPLDNPYCAGAEVCFRGKEVDQESPTTENPQLKGNNTNFSRDDPGNDGNLSTGAIVGIAVGCTAAVAIVILLLVVVVVIRWRNLQSKPTGIPSQIKTFTAPKPDPRSLRPPAPLPRGATTPDQHSESDYECVYDLQEDRRASVISEALQRSRAASVDSQGPRTPRKTSLALSPWPWPYNDVRMTPSKTPPPIPSSNRPGVDNDGYLKCI